MSLYKCDAYGNIQSSYVKIHNMDMLIQIQDATRGHNHIIALQTCSYLKTAISASNVPDLI